MQNSTHRPEDIFKDLVFSKEEIRLIESKFHRVNAKKGTVLVTTGDNVTDMYFIVDGCLRTYHVDKHGKEHTVQFGIEDWWITDFTAFFSNTKAIMNLEVLRNAILYRISRENRDELNLKIPKIETHIRKKLESAYAAFQKRILSNLSQTAKERYLNFINTYPNIDNSVKNYHIASYLGITTQSLSRIRKELSRS